MRSKETFMLPCNYIALNADEMSQIDGGINIGMTRGYLDKTICMAQGRGIIKTYNWTNVTGLQLAKEIYGHAVVYYKLSILDKVPILNDKIYSHAANGVDVEDAVDKYQSVWDMIWDL